MGKHSVRIRSRLILLIGIILALSACTDGLSAPDSNGSVSTQEVNVAMEYVLSIIPGQTTEENVKSQFGEPGGTEEPLLNEWTWLYALSDDGISLARITLDTSSSIKTVKSVAVVEPDMTIEDLSNALGEPVIIYEDLANERFVLAYPLQGIEAVILGNPEQPGESIVSVSRTASESVQTYLDRLRTRSDVQIITAP